MTNAELEELVDRKARYAKLIEIMKDWPEQDRLAAERRGMTLKEYCDWCDENFKPEPIRI